MRDWKRAIRAPIQYSITNEVVRLQTTFVSVIAVLGTLVLFVLYLMLPSTKPLIVSAKYHDHDDHHINTFGGRKISEESSAPLIAAIPEVKIVYNCSTNSNINQDINKKINYNPRYPLTPPIKVNSRETKYRIALIADLDQNSRNGNYNEWHSFLLKGWLTHTIDGDVQSTGDLSKVSSDLNGIKVTNDETKNKNLKKRKRRGIIPTFNNNIKDKIKIVWDRKRIQLTSSISGGSRGMELSELIVFNGKLYSCDDRTGIIFEIVTDDDSSSTASSSKVTSKAKVIPRFILSDGDGNTDKGFKCEWMTIKDNHLIVGGLGKEWVTPTGSRFDYPLYIKNITADGVISHVNWIDNYEKVKAKAGIQSPGYLVHESCCWSSYHSKYFFLPRRASSTAYNEVEDENKGTNLLISADEEFKDIKVQTVGPVIASHGFSSFKFLPGTNDRIIIAIKSMERLGIQSTFVTAFTIDGDILLPETRIQNANVKYEGIEFI